MTSIYLIAFEDIKVFLKTNEKSFKNKNDAYNIALKLLKGKKYICSSVKIEEWIHASNLLKNKINIPKYNIYEINSASQDEINNLSNSLTMKDNYNITNILKYLGKLEERISFLPEINNVIIDKYSRLLELEVLSCNLCDLIKIFKNNRFLRKYIYYNMIYIVGNYGFLKISNDNNPVADFVFELVELKENFLAKKVLELYNIYSPKSDAILSCSRDFIKRYIK